MTDLICAVCGGRLFMPPDLDVTDVCNLCAKHERDLFRAEVATLRTKVAELLAFKEGVAPMIESYQVKLTELEMDKARLDWLFSELKDSTLVFKLAKIAQAFALRSGGCHDFRTAMDEVIKRP